MWLLPLFSIVSRIAARVYYRLSYAGRAVPRSGPVLLVANHPNSLFDPVLVVGAAGRRVRFLAKAPLFTDAKVGWLVRASGAIPVYRRSDDPSQVSRNEEMFRAVHSALADGAAVAIFPEGISHSEPGLTPLKTGAARIALGFAAGRRQPFPIIPVGLVFRAKDVFRSEAQVIVGDAVEWADLVGRDVADAEAVLTLTTRIERAMRAVTVNLDTWEDAPLVECAVDVWEVARSDPRPGLDRVARLKVTTELLQSVREGGAPSHRQVADEVRRHAARLASLRLTPAELGSDPRATTALRWSARRLAVFSPPAVAIALIGHLLFWVPFTVTGRIAEALGPALDQRATYKLLVGIPVYALWVVFLAIACGLAWGPTVSVSVLLGLPALGMVALWIRERLRGARQDARSFLFLRSRRELTTELRVRQDELAEELDAVYRHYQSPEAPA